ncbi:MAG TPA: hypothetical protein VGX02_10775 [Candidatus Eremiobacteraceae bacterium]|jgi:hypothetical protein|nr:hypothetical protein [Candidatus Eremiobacteraceae bacterium]
MHTLLIGLILALPTPIIADASGTVQTSNGYTYTAADAHQAIAGYQRMYTDHNFTLLTEMAGEGEMPAYDRVAHYQGSKRLPTGQLAYDIWLNERYRSALDDLTAADPAIAAQIMSAMLLAAFDGGMAGPKWKAMYDDAAHRDRLLGPTVLDRYQNRHALVALLAQDRSAYAISAKPQGVMGLNGTKLTEAIHYAPGLPGFAQAGVGAARITELMDDQRSLAEAPSQQYIDDWFTHFGAMLSSAGNKDFLDQQRSLLAVNPSFDRVRNSQAFGQAIQTLANRLASDQTGSFLIGLYAEQADLNASTSQQENIDSVFRSEIGQDAALDASMPKLAAMRRRLSGLSAGDWGGIQKQSAAIVSYILSAR